MSEPLPPDQHRVADSDREQVVEHLRQAAGDGRLTLDELDSRLDAAFAARTYGELAPLTRDLPQPAGRPAAGLPTRVAGTKGRRWSMAVMSSSKHRGRWVVGSEHTAVSVMGDVRLDLSQAELETPEVTIWAFSVMGDVHVAVPADCRLEASGLGLMGEFRSADEAPAPATGAPVVRVRGLAVMGGVHAVRKAARNP